MVKLVDYSAAFLAVAASFLPLATTGTTNSTVTDTKPVLTSDDMIIVKVEAVINIFLFPHGKKFQTALTLAPRMCVNLPGYEVEIT
jgi:hypothetical protein